jgi:mercuric reductase
MIKNIFGKKERSPQNIETVSLNIEGMTCGGCSSHIEKDLTKKDGIVSCAVNHETGKGDFTFNADTLKEQDIIDAINKVGSYKVVESKNDCGCEEGTSCSTTTNSKDETSLNKGNNQYDLIIIGGGSAAFSAAIKAESLGLTTLMVNGGLDFGGTCVNVGCVPSKILIRAGESAYHSSHSNFNSITPKGADIDFKQLIQTKKEMVKSLQQQKYLNVVSDFQNLKMVKGWAEFVDANTIIVDGKDTYTALKFVIATGSTTNIPNIEGLQDVGYLTNVSLFDLEEKPDSITIMGAGYIGLEIAQAYSRLGVKVRIIEFTDRPLRSQTKDITDVLETQFKDENIEILPNFRAIKFEKKDGVTIIHCKCPDGSTTQLEEKGKIVVATGTTPNTAKLGLKNIGLNLTKSGNIIVSNKMETNVANIFAAGDVTNTPPFVYTAATEGNTAIINAFSGETKKVDYTSLPWVVFTDPQVAGAGIDEVEAAKQNIPFEISKIGLDHVPRAIAACDTRGFIKLIRNTETDQLIGARVIAPEGGELIQQLSMAIKFGITVKQLAESLYPYLTLGEGIKLAAITFGKDVSKLSCCAS